MLGCRCGRGSRGRAGNRAAHQDDAAQVIVERADDREPVAGRDRRNPVFRRAENEFLAGAFDARF